MTVTGDSPLTLRSDVVAGNDLDGNVDFLLTRYDRRLQDCGLRSTNLNSFDILPQCNYFQRAGD